MELIGRIRFHKGKLSMMVKIHKTKVPWMVRPEGLKNAEPVDKNQLDLFRDTTLGQGSLNLSNTANKTDSDKSLNVHSTDTTQHVMNMVNGMTHQES